MQLDVMLGGSTYWFFPEAERFQTDGMPFDRLGVAAWDHPLYVMLGQVFVLLPFGEPTYRINLMSAVAGSLAIALVFRLGEHLSSNRWAALLGALALAVSHTFWFHSVTSEAYTLNIVFMVSLIWLALRWTRERRWSQLAAFCFLAGLGLANHLMLAITILPLIAFIAIQLLGPPTAFPARAGRRLARLLDRRSEAFPWRRAGMLIGWFLLGFAPWIVQSIRVARLIGVPLTLQVAIGFPWLGQRWGLDSPFETLSNLAGYIGWLSYQFTPLGVALGGYGYGQLRRVQPQVARLLLLIFLTHIAFSANYSLADQFNFHLPSYVIFSLAIACGFARLMRRLEATWHPPRMRLAFFLKGPVPLVIVLAPVVLYPLTPSALDSLGITETSLGINPIGSGARNTFGYFLSPNKRGDNTAAEFGRSTLRQLDREALVFTAKPSDQETYVVLRYAQLVEGLRPDVHLELMIFDPLREISRAVRVAARAQMWCRPLYLASLDTETYPMDSLQADFEIVPEANLYRLLPRGTKPASVFCPALDARWAALTPEQLVRRAMRAP